MSSSKKAKMRKYGIHFAIPILAISLIFVFSFIAEGEDKKEAMPTELAWDGVSSQAQAAAAPQRRQQSACPPFSQEGALCEVTPSCSGWIRNAPELPVGSTYVIQPRRDVAGTPASERVYRSIRYLDKSGRTRVLGDNDMPSDVIAWEFCPKVTTTMSYSAT